MTVKERDAKIAQMSEDIACIKQALMGNGTRGLADRVTDLEKEKRRRLVVQMATMAVIFAGIEIAGKLFKWW